MLSDCPYIVGNRCVGVEIDFIHGENCGSRSLSKNWTEISWSGLNNIVNDVRWVGVVESCALHELIEALLVDIGHGRCLKKRGVVHVSDQEDSGGVVT